MKKQETKKAPSKYQLKVLDTNKALRQDSNTLGYCIRVLLSLEDTPAEFKKELRAMQKDSAKYKKAAGQVRKTSKGYYRPFYLLQYLYKKTK